MLLISCTVDPRGKLFNALFLYTLNALKISIFKLLFLGTRVDRLLGEAKKNIS